MSQRKNALIASLTGGLLVLAFIFHFADLFTLKDYSLIAATLIAGYFISTRAFQALRMKAFSIELLVTIDRKSTRLNSSHVAISYAVFCLKKKRSKYTQV